MGMLPETTRFRDPSSLGGSSGRTQENEPVFNPSMVDPPHSPKPHLNARIVALAPKSELCQVQKWVKQILNLKDDELSINSLIEKWATDTN